MRAFVGGEDSEGGGKGRFESLQGAGGGFA